ncbi:GIY-YIG nuclease family protein, partial [Sphingobacterium anhuiense]
TLVQIIPIHREWSLVRTQYSPHQSIDLSMLFLFTPIFMYFLYILYSLSCDRYYIGVSSDVEGRLRRHNAVHKKGFTGRAQDWEVVYQEEYGSKHDALIRETLIKSWKSRLKIEELIRV